MPIWDDVSPIEPAWYGVKGMVGLFWTYDRGAWVGRR